MFSLLPGGEHGEGWLQEGPPGHLKKLELGSQIGDHFCSLPQVGLDTVLVEDTAEVEQVVIEGRELVCDDREGGDYGESEIACTEIFIYFLVLAKGAKGRAYVGHTEHSIVDHAIKLCVQIFITRCLISYQMSSPRLSQPSKTAIT